MSLSVPINDSKGLETYEDSNEGDWGKIFIKDEGDLNVVEEAFNVFKINDVDSSVVLTGVVALLGEFDKPKCGKFISLHNYLLQVKYNL